VKLVKMVARTFFDKDHIIVLDALLVKGRYVGGIGSTSGVCVCVGRLHCVVVVVCL
jgi:hypothetical protein